MMHAVAHGGCTDMGAVRTWAETALKVDCGKKIPCRIKDSNCISITPGFSVSHCTLNWAISACKRLGKKMGSNPRQCYAWLFSQTLYPLNYPILACSCLGRKMMNLEWLWRQACDSVLVQIAEVSAATQEGLCRAQDWPQVMVWMGTGLAPGHGANGHRTGPGSWCERAQDRPRVMARTGTGLATGHSMNGPMTVATDWATVRWSHQLGFVVQSSVMFVLHCLLQ